MIRFGVVVFCVSLVLVAAGCSGSQSDTNQNTNTAQVSNEYTDANAALNDGSKFLDEGEIDKAIDVLNQAVKLNPELAEAWFKLGIAYALFEKRDETLEKISNVDSNSEESTTPKKPTKTNSEKAFEKAVAAYKKAIDANDEDHVAYFNLGRAYNKLNEDQDAAKALKQAVKLNPEDTEYQTELGAILIKLAQYHEAIAPLKKALELDPENIRAMELLEDAEAGRSRVNYSSTPKEDKKSSSSNSSSNTNTGSPGQEKPPTTTATPTPQLPKPRPTASRPAGN
jgi:tetratricopeptide (TPR) repeat protein